MYRAVQDYGVLQESVQTDHGVNWNEGSLGERGCQKWATSRYYSAGMGVGLEIADCIDSYQRAEERTKIREDKIQ